MVFRQQPIAISDVSSSMGSPWIERNSGYVSVQENNNETRISEENFNSFLQASSKPAHVFHRSSTPATSPQRNVKSLSNAHPGVHKVSQVQWYMVVVNVLLTLLHFVQSSDLLILTRTSRRKFFFHMCFLVVLIFPWILYPLIISAARLQGGHIADFQVSRNLMFKETGPFGIQWRDEVEKQLYAVFDKKWNDHVKQMEEKWLSISQEIELWQKSVLDKVKDVKVNSKTVEEQVSELKIEFESQLSDRSIYDSSTRNGFEKLVDRLSHFEEKSRNLENLFYRQRNWCKKQADLNVELSSLIHKLQANLSEITRNQEPMIGNCQKADVAPTLEEIKKTVETALNRYDSDKTGLVDYALETAGGSVVTVRGTDTYAHGTTQFTLFGLPFWKSRNSPRAIIQPQVHPGECWAMRGSKGSLVIQLFASIRPTAFSLEHIPKTLAPMGNIDSAPKEFSVLGLYSEYDTEGQLLGNYTYTEDGEPLQMFYVQNVSDKTFSLIELSVHSNHGNLEYTCLYRFRVHGVQV